MAGRNIKSLFEEKSPSEPSLQKNLVLKEKSYKLLETSVIDVAFFKSKA